MIRAILATVFIFAVSFTALPSFSQSSSELVAQAKQAQGTGDLKRAFKLYKHAADKNGNAVAINAVGVMFMNGMGVSQSDRSAFFWIKKAAERGYPAAQKNLGILYAQGVWVKPNEAKALEWFRLAASNGDPQAQSLFSQGTKPPATNSNTKPATKTIGDEKGFAAPGRDLQPKPSKLRTEVEEVIARGAIHF